MNSTNVYQGTTLFVELATSSQATNIFCGRVTIEYINLTTIDHLCQVIVTHVSWATDKDPMVKKQSMNKLAPQLFEILMKATVNVLTKQL